MLSFTLSSIARRVHIAVCIVLASLCLSACIVRTSTLTPEPVSLTFACPDDELQFYQDAAESFRQDNPSIRIHILSVEDVVSFPLDEMDVLGPVRDLASQADVFLWTDDGAEGGPVGLVLDLTRYIEGDEEMVEGAFLPDLLARFQWQGSTWAVPSSVSASFVAYDPLAFDEAGLEHPVPGWMWEDLAYAAQQLTRREGEQVIRYGADLGVDAVQSAVEARGGRLVDDSKEIAVPLLDDPRTVAAVQWYTDLALSQGVVKNPAGTQFRTPIDTLVRGETAMSIVPSGMWPPKTGTKDRALLLVPLPGKSRVNSRGYYVSAGTAHPEAAWRWIQYLSHEVVPPGGLPARQRSVHESPHVQTIGEEATTTFLYAVEHTLSPTRPTIVERLLYDATERILSGQPVGDTLARAQQVALNPDTSLETEAVAVSTVVSTPALATEQIRFCVDFQAVSRYRKLAEAFHETHPDIQVHLVRDVDVTDFDWKEGLSGMISASGADCLLWSTTLLPVDVKQKPMLDLQPLADADPAFPWDDYVPQALKTVRHGGKLWSLPASMYVRTLRYDPILFEEAGLAYPGGDWTWDDLLEAAQQLSGVESVEQHYGFLIWLDAPFLVEVLAGQLLDAGVDPPRYRFSDPDVAVAVRRVVELVRDRVIPAPEIEAHPELEGVVMYGMMPLDRAIRDGRVGMWLERAGEAHWGLGKYGRPANLPLGYWEDTISVPGAYYIAADTPHIKACWQWLRFLSEQIPADGNLPPRYSLLTSDAYCQSAGQAFQSVYLDTLERAAQLPQGRLDELPLGYRWPEQWFEQALEEIVWQGADLENTLSEVQGQADAFRACMQWYVGRESLETVEGCAQKARPEGPGVYLLTPAEVP